MSAPDLAVVAAGIAAIAWVNWYFFFAERATAVATAPASGGARASGSTAGAEAIPEVTIEVKGGYVPATVRARAGEPLRLVFDRQETSSCSEEIVFPDFGVRKFLPPFRKTTIELTPPAAGRYEFTCGMGMLHGALIAE
jgi:plastocyanin domain-containing protein